MKVFRSPDKIGTQALKCIATMFCCQIEQNMLRWYHANISEAKIYIKTYSLALPYSRLRNKNIYSYKPLRIVEALFFWLGIAIRVLDNVMAYTQSRNFVAELILRLIRRFKSIALSFNCKFFD